MIPPQLPWYTYSHTPNPETGFCSGSLRDATGRIIGLFGDIKVAEWILEEFSELNRLRDDNNHVVTELETKIESLNKQLVARDSTIKSLQHRIEELGSTFNEITTR